ncbi:MAG: hypothetical protein Q4G59_01230 [Planctomycetia bacterium]|nr:hypothetical protein [Planctomycetia bacterium]
MSALRFKKSSEPKPKKEKKVKEKKVKEKKVKEPKAQKTPKPARPKVPANKYTLLLLFALLAMIAACVMLYLDLQSYK